MVFYFPGIPLGKQWWVGDGPIEPRVTTVKGKFLITFNAATAFDVTKHLDWTVSYVVKTNAHLDRAIYFPDISDLVTKQESSSAVVKSTTCTCL